jgi:hypothetical protein
MISFSSFISETTDKPATVPGAKFRSLMPAHGDQSPGVGRSLHLIHPIPTHQYLQRRMIMIVRLGSSSQKQFLWLDR